MGKTKRINWIDCTKAIAITAVVIDHCYGVLYMNHEIALGTYFSVGLFIMLSGLSAQIASRNKEIKSIGYQIKKIAGFFKDYAIATFIIYILTYQLFDFWEYISYLFQFSISPPLYFFVFFFQLLLISPYLLSWCRFCEKQKLPYLWHAMTVVGLGCLSAIMIKYTYILPLHGGGKYMFGGTYILMYYIGILFGEFHVFERKKLLPIFLVSLLGWIIWWRMRCLQILPFDNVMEPFWGEGTNPPSIELMIQAILSAFVCYALFTLLESRGQIGSAIVNAGCILGKYTLYTFMYHWLIRDKLITNFPDIYTYPIWIKLMCIIFMIIGPVMVKILLDKAMQGYREKKRAVAN